MAKNKFKTGEKAPETGKYKVDELVNGGSPSGVIEEISLQEGDQFPPSPGDQDAVYWVRA
ncbi:YjzC family protein [Evansella clarkii]|jgi:hypothetical protein|uniref:YjzC family protein n=1 Tax=Evansella clarkii TaxID=79879 RepID=UPI000998801A|nr:YjzC family protein [Evansella clarkii]